MDSDREGRYDVLVRPPPTAFVLRDRLARRRNRAGPRIGPSYCRIGASFLHRIRDAVYG